MGGMDGVNYNSDTGTGSGQDPGNDSDASSAHYLVVVRAFIHLS